MWAWLSTVKRSSRLPWQQQPLSQHATAERPSHPCSRVEQQTDGVQPGGKTRTSPPVCPSPVCPHVSLPHMSPHCSTEAEAADTCPSAFLLAFKLMWLQILLDCVFCCIIFCVMEQAHQLLLSSSLAIPYLPFLLLPVFSPSSFLSYSSLPPFLSVSRPLLPYASSSSTEVMMDGHLPPLGDGPTLEEQCMMGGRNPFHILINLCIELLI